MNAHFLCYLDQKQCYEGQQDNQHSIFRGTNTFLILINGDEQFDAEISATKFLVVVRPLLCEWAIKMKDLP